MRITINYFDGYPELEAELAKFSPRVRAERFRSLAAIGLAIVNKGSAASGENERASTTPTEKAEPPQKAKEEETSHAQTSAAKMITKNIFKQA